MKKYLKKYLILLTKFYLLFSFGIFKVYSKEYVIRYKDSNWNSLPTFLNKNQQSNDDLVLKFEDTYYRLDNVPVMSFIDVSVSTNIKFIGNEKGTIFDYYYSFHSFYFKMNQANTKENSITFENIIFKNYQYPSKTEGFGVVLVEAPSKNFNLIFENCNFEGNRNSVIRLDIKDGISSKDDYSVIINNCKFMYIFFLFIIIYIFFKNNYFSFLFYLNIFFYIIISCILYIVIILKEYLLIIMLRLIEILITISKLKYRIVILRKTMQCFIVTLEISKLTIVIIYLISFLLFYIKF